MQQGHFSDTESDWSKAQYFVHLCIMEVTFLRKSMTAVGPLWCTKEKYRDIGTLANSRNHTSPCSAEEKMNSLMKE